MKKNDLKALIKPLVKECIHEVLLEEGLLSNVVAEVARGMQGNLVVETQQKQTNHLVNESLQMKHKSHEARTKLKAHRAKLMDSINTDAYNGVNLFEGTTPAPGQTTPTQQSSPMSGQSPTDPGVDIGNLFGSVGRNWGAHMNNVKKESR